MSNIALLIIYIDMAQEGVSNFAYHNIRGKKKALSTARNVRIGLFTISRD